MDRHDSTQSGDWDCWWGVVQAVRSSHAPIREYRLPSALPCQWMAVFGGDEEEIKAAAREFASKANVTAAVSGFAAAAVPTSPLAPTLGLTAAACALFAAAQSRIADDPPRNDWNRYPPPVPLGVEEAANRNGLGDLPPGDPAALQLWMASAIGLAHCASASLLCAERLAGIRESAIGDFALGGGVGDVHRVLGRYFDAQANRYWFRLRVLGSGSRTPLESALESIGIDADRIVYSTAVDEALLAAEEILQVWIDRLRVFMNLQPDEWDVLDRDNSRPASLEDVAVVRESGGAPLLGSWPSGRYREPPSLVSAFR